MNKPLVIGLSVLGVVLAWGLMFYAGVFSPEPAVAIQTKSPNQVPAANETSSVSEVSAYQSVAPRDLNDSTSSNKPSAPHVFASTKDYENVSTYGPLPSHLQRVALRKLAWDDQGNLVVEPKIKDLIESFLTASRFEGRENAIARIAEYMSMTLPEPAASQALAILDNYIAYKNEMLAFQMSTSGSGHREHMIETFRQALDQRKQIRRDTLGDETATALFGDEELYDEFSVNRMRIMSDPTLTDKEKETLLIESENILPEAKRKHVRWQREKRTLDRRIAELKSAGGNEQKIYQLRVDFYDKETADRMRYLESTSPQWERRVASFNQEWYHIEQRTDLSATEKAELVSELRDSSFTKKEQVKLAVQNIKRMAGE